jgi:hypothetical protein
MKSERFDIHQHITQIHVLLIVDCLGKTGYKSSLYGIN